MIDIFNATILLVAGSFMLISVRRVLADKAVKGVVWYSTAIYLCLDASNLIIYWRSYLWFSVAAMAYAMATAGAWVFLAIWYGRRA